MAPPGGEALAALCQPDEKPAGQALVSIADPRPLERQVASQVPEVSCLWVLTPINS